MQTQNPVGNVSQSEDINNVSRSGGEVVKPVRIFWTEKADYALLSCVMTHKAHIIEKRVKSFNEM